MTSTLLTTEHHRHEPPCHCKAYPFPHREGSGKCYANEDGPFCGKCGKPCVVEVRDNGIGAYEFWGFKGVDHRIELESQCCDAHCYENAELTMDYEPGDDH